MSAYDFKDQNYFKKYTNKKNLFDPNKLFSSDLNNRLNIMYEEDSNN